MAGKRPYRVVRAIRPSSRASRAPGSMASFLSGRTLGRTSGSPTSSSNLSNSVRKLSLNSEDVEPGAALGTDCAGWQLHEQKIEKPQYNRAGDGNRTRIASLEGWSSTIELRPHQPPNA